MALVERRKIVSKDSEIRKLAKDIGASLLSDAPTSKEKLEFVSSGSTELDCCLGGGFIYGSIVNVVGDESTGKTLLACEIIAHAQREQNAVIVFLDKEGTLQSEQAKRIGVLTDEVILEDEASTVEDFFNSVVKFVEKQRRTKRPFVYIVDSLDALTSEAEEKTDIKDTGYGVAKAKKMSEIMRRLVSAVHKSKVLLVIVSQTRDKIGVTFGAKWTVAGGKALGFYCTHRILLAQIAKLKTSKDKKTAKIYGVKIRAKVIKNKIAPPFKEAEFEIFFDRGIDDLGSCIDYLKNAGYYDKTYDYEKKKFNSKEKFIKYIEDNNLEDYIKKLTIGVWEELNKVDTKRKSKW